MTMTVPGAQQAELTFEADTPAQFRELLGKIREASGLSCGQIAIKTAMPRSTAYSLPNTNRPGLPSNPEQVRAFVRACGLAEVQVDLVMDRWAILHNRLDALADRPDHPDDREASINDGIASITYHLAQQLLAKEPGPVYWNPESLTSAADTVEAPVSRFGLGWRRKHSAQPTASWPDLLHFVLQSEDRSRRAARLLIPLMAMVVAGVAGLVVIAVAVPAIAPIVVAVLAVLLLLPLLRGLRRVPAKRG